MSVLSRTIARVVLRGTGTGWPRRAVVGGTRDRIRIVASQRCQVVNGNLVSGEQVGRRRQYLHRQSDERNVLLRCDFG